MAETDRPMTDAEWREAVGKVLGVMFGSLLDVQHRQAALISVLVERGVLDRGELEAAVERQESSMVSFMRAEAVIDDDMRRALDYIERRVKQSGGPT
jgi:hypothetical protein